MSRFRLAYRLLVPLILVASAVLGYYAWLTASQFARLGESTILENSQELLNDKVAQVERRIITSDTAVMNAVDLEEPATIEAAWPPVPVEVLGSVTDVLVLDEVGNVVAHAGEGDPARRRALRKIVQERILPDLELERRTTGKLGHLHRTYAGKSTLVSFRDRVHRGQRYYLLVRHDTDAIRENFATLFTTEEGKRLYNVVDESNERVYGPSLAGAGDYLVGRRFPTTLYRWRLQFAPKQAPLLDSKGRSRRLSDAALIGTSFLVILLGVAFLIYAAGKERRVNALKAEFVANVSHELKTPLSVIRMFAELLSSGRVATDAKREEYLSIICRESERMSTLVENVLDFAALERGRRTWELREGDLVATVSRAVDTFRQRGERPAVELRVPGEAPPEVRLDEQAIVLATMNLLDNAAKYAAGSPIEVTIDGARDQVRVHVRDHGPGIPGEDLRRVFDRFYRSRTSQDVRGSGIGLSLVRHIAEAHGGTAWAENMPDGGAQVSFSVPTPRPAGADRTASTDAPREGTEGDRLPAGSTAGVP